MWCPVSFFVFSQLPNHFHCHLVQSLHQSISLWVVGCGLQLLHNKDLAHFFNYTAHEVSTSATQEPGLGSKDGDVTLIQEFSGGFCSLIGGHTNTCFVKWSWNTKMLVTLCDWFSSKVVSVLVKSTCRRSRGVVAMIGCKGTMAKLPSCCKQCVQVLMDCCIWLLIPGHQKHSSSKDGAQSQPWCPASQWHPFRAVTQCTLGTTKSSKSSFSPLGIEYGYRAFWWIMKFWWFLKTSWPSSLEVCSPKSGFRSVFFWTSNQSNRVLSARFLSGLWPNWSHAFQLTTTQQQHTPLFPCHGHFNHYSVITLCPMSDSEGYSI